MSKRRILLHKRFDHFIGNGTHVHHPADSTGEFDEPLANSLVYEGIGSFAPDETADEAEDDERKSEGDAPANKARKAAPANKARK